MKENELEHGSDKPIDLVPDVLSHLPKLAAYQYT